MRCIFVAHKGDDFDELLRRAIAEANTGLSDVRIEVGRNTMGIGLYVPDPVNRERLLRIWPKNWNQPGVKT